jgi:putative phosphoribosyl transferase
VVERYDDRRHAGRVLASQLGGYAGRADVTVLALPRGGVPVALEVARALAAPLDVLAVRKLGVPQQPELAMGALASGGVVFIDDGLVSRLGISRSEVAATAAAAARALSRAERAYRGRRPPLAITGRTVILVDDGLATGATMRAAVAAARRRGAAQVVVAVPVAPPETCAELGRLADDVVCPATPPLFLSVGQWYADFSPTTDEEVAELLQAAAPPRAGAGEEAEMTSDEREVAITVAEGLTLDGTLTVPAGAAGVVLFAHGSGSSRHSPRNRFVAAALHEAGLGTLLFDLLTTTEEEAEALTGHLRFDIELLTERLVGATGWLAGEPSVGSLPLGYFGASTGAAAALAAAARQPERVGAVVSRGGRPDLAPRDLPDVRAPTLLIVGGADTPVIDMNQTALRLLTCEKRLTIVPGATHLFEEPGALERVAELAAEWFGRHLGRPLGAAASA